MNNNTSQQATGASQTTRFFCTQISSAAGAVGELCTTKRKDPDMGKRNTNSWEGQRPRCPQPQPETAENAKTQLFSHVFSLPHIPLLITPYPQIPQSNFYSSWGPSPEVPQTTSNWVGQRPRCPQPPKSSYLKNSTITSADFHSSKGPTPEVTEVKSHISGFKVPQQLKLVFCI